MPRLTLSIAELIGLIIIYQGLFFAVSIQLRKGRKDSFNRVLSVFTCLIALNFLNIILISQKALTLDRNFGLVFGFLYGPVFRLYSECLINRSKKIRPADLLPFVPAGIAFVFILFSGNLLKNEQSLIFWTIAVVIHLFYYLVSAYLHIQSFQKMLKNNFSAIDSMKLSWLKTLIFFIGGIILLSGIEAFLPVSYPEVFNDLYLLIINLLTLLMMNFIFYKGLKYPEIFSNQLVPLPDKKYLHSNLNDEEYSRVLEDLDACMKEKKPYLNDELALKDLADLIDASPRNLSRVINEQKGMNFYDFINGYRIEEACRLLETRSNSELRINEVMYESGFRSKSTFNHVFKSRMKMTPKEYRISKREGRETG